jgi:DNA-binding GntR family transcriptional regulator
MPFDEKLQRSRKMLEIPRLRRAHGLKEQAYDQIRSLILTGRLTAETVYSAAQFAEMLGVSRTPVREALLQLVTEGFLTVIKQEGYTLRRFTEKEIRELFETRRLIETYVAEQITGKLTDADVRQLRAMLKSMVAFAEAKNTAGFLETDRAFHMALVQRLDNRLLASIMENIRGQVSLFAMQAVASHKGRTDEILREHGDILETLRGKDSRKAVRAVVDHLETTQKHVLGYFQTSAKS